MSFPLTALQMQCLPIVRGLVANKLDGLGDPWLPPSYVFGHVTIESGWLPAVVSTDGLDSIGLMQMQPGDVQQMIAQGYLDPSTADQTVPANSLASGIAYLTWGRADLMRRWNFQKTILYRPVCIGYNEGYAAAGMGEPDARYYLKWAAAQQKFAFVDA